MNEFGFEKLEAELTQEIKEAIEAAIKDETVLFEVQPTEGVIQLAASAAAKVLVAFERSYQLDQGE